jgi:hypothetical protein
MIYSLKDNYYADLISCRFTIDLSLGKLKVKSWLRINRRMSTLFSAIRGINRRGKTVVARMKRISLGIVVYLI